MRKNLINIPGNDNNNYENKLKDLVKPDWMDPSEVLPEWIGDVEWKECLGTKEEYEKCIIFKDKRTEFQVLVVISVILLLQFCFCFGALIYYGVTTKITPSIDVVPIQTTGVMYMQGGTTFFCNPWCNIIGFGIGSAVLFIATFAAVRYTINLYTQLKKLESDKYNMWGLSGGGKAPWIMRISNRIFSKLFL